MSSWPAMHIVMEINGKTLTVWCVGTPHCCDVLQYLLQQHYILLLNVGVDIWRDSTVAALMFYQLKVGKLKRWGIFIWMWKRQQNEVWFFCYHKVRIPNFYGTTSGKVEIQPWCCWALLPKKDFEADSTASRALKVVFIVLKQKVAFGM